MVELKHERQSYRDFGGGHRQDEDEHHLPIRLRPTRAGHHKCQSGGIQHDFNGHQNEQQVPPHQQADQAQREQDPGQKQPVIHGND